MPAEQRPHFISLYFEHVDTDSHAYGVGAKQTIAEIKRVDRYLGKLLDGIDKLPFSEDVYVVLVSDHGQASYDMDTNILILGGLLDLDGITVVDGGAFAYLYFDQEDPERARRIVDQINPDWRYGRAWLPGETPEHWHVTERSNFPDVIVQPYPHYAVLSAATHIGSPPYHRLCFTILRDLYIYQSPLSRSGKSLATMPWLAG